MGAINVKHTGSGADIALSSDGTSLLLDGTAIGGGGGAAIVETKPDAYTVTSDDLGKIFVFTGSWNEYGTLGTTADLGAGFYITIVNQSGSRHTINRTGTTDIFFPNGSSGPTQLVLASGASITLLSDGTSKWLAKNQSYYLYTEGNNNGGNFKPTATGTNAVAIGRGANAQGSPSFAAGTNSGFGGSTANSAGSTALGGSYASGTNSFAAAIANNTATYGATGANSVAIGQQNKATATDSLAIGGQNNQSTSFYSMCLGANGGQATANYSAVVGGYKPIASKSGQIAFGTGYSAGWTTAPQTSLMTLSAETADATPAELGVQSQRLTLPNNSAYAFHGTIVARQQASQGTASAAWKIEGLIRREGSAGTTVLVNSATTVLDNTPAWGMALSADTTNGGLKIEVTGAAATNIRFVATINTSEVTY